MTNFSPKLEIINHFDSLINRIDIDIEQSLDKYNKDQVLGKIRYIEYKNRYIARQHFNFVIIFHDSYRESLSFAYKQEKSYWSESTKVVDFLNQVRMTTIEELRKAQEDCLEYIKLNSSRFSTLSDLTDDKRIDELKSELFGEKFYFQVNFSKSDQENWIFNLYTFFTDFYMSPSDIDLLQ